MCENLAKMAELIV